MGRVVASLSVVLLACLAVAGPASADVPPPPCHVPAHPVRPPSYGLKLGVDAPLLEYADDDIRCAEVGRILATGARYDRQELRWSQIEPHAGTYHWTAVDRTFVSAAEEGLTLVPLIDDTPAWAHPGGSDVPRDRVAFGHFLAAVAGRYGPHGSFWRRHPALPNRPATWFELYNEPYQPPGRPDPAAYARMVRVAVPSARRANPRARFLIAGETTWVDAEGHLGGDWTAALYTAVPQFGRWFDGVAVHPYSIRSPLQQAPPDESRDLSRRLEDVEAVLAAHGDARHHLWVTEVGWSTCTAPTECITEAQQARYLSDFLRLATTRWHPYLDAVLVYALHSYPHGPAAVAPNYGLLRADGRPKPAWQVFRNAALRALGVRPAG